jgi:mRNA interferase MazF
VAGGIAGGEIRLYAFAPPDKSRPVVVLKRDSAVSYLSTVTVAPITSRIRGVPSEVLLDQEPLGKRVAQLSAPRLSEICRAAFFIALR